MIKDVAQEISIYAMSCFLLHDGVVKDIHLIMAEYWWNGKGKGSSVHLAVFNATLGNNRVVRRDMENGNGRWLPNVNRLVKANFDVAISKELGYCGLGVVFRDDQGNFVTAAVEKIRDALLVIQSLERECEDFSSLGPLRDDIRHGMKEREVSLVSWVRRSGNGSTHLVAKMALECNDRVLWMHAPPKLLQPILLADKTFST
ncbi:hypothetical protein ACH5RR_003451 [Cinchona calisaya]|uniref:RNase H type-1 domain-containing protein n=1 Tax=Cinchona calisaya TaxID=153742 RepID=A0ABD3AUX1_9GENT